MSAEQLVEQGNAAFRSGDLDGALRKYESALALEPTNGRAHFNLGVILQSRERLDEAIDHYRSALDANPRFAAALVNWGNVMRQKGDDAAAADLYARALEIDANDRHALGNLARLAEAASGRGDAALAEEACNAVADSLERVLQAAPGDANLHFNLGVALQRLERLDEAISHYARAAAEDPRHVGALINWGEALRLRGEGAEARERLGAALALEPGNVRALNNLATLALDEGEIDEAQGLFERAAAADPAREQPPFNLGIIALHRQDFARGWEAYERRFRVFTSGLPRPLAGTVPFDPHDGGVKRLAVAREQGIGDQILFSTLFPELERLGVDADVEVDERLRGAYARSLRGLRFVTPRESAEAFAGASHYIAMGSLARLFRPTLESFARQPSSLLVADPHRVAEMRAQLAPGPRIAISWRTFQPGVRRYVQSRKAIPLPEFGRLAVTGARLLDLQYGDAGEERRAFDRQHPGLRVELPGLDRFNDLEGLLAAITSCDCVVTSSNITAHLAGVLGKRTYLLYLGGKPVFHYWAAGTDGRSLWYPSVEIVTDPSWREWGAAFGDVLRRIRER